LFGWGNSGIKSVVFNLMGSVSSELFVDTGSGAFFIKFYVKCWVSVKSLLHAWLEKFPKAYDLLDNRGNPAIKKSL